MNYFYWKPNPVRKKNDEWYEEGFQHLNEYLKEIKSSKNFYEYSDKEKIEILNKSIAQNMALNLRNGEQLWSQEILMSAINEADEQKKDYNVLKNDFIKDPSKRLKSFKRENETLQKWNSTNPVFRRLYSEQYSEIMAGVQNLQGSLHQQAFFGNDTIYAHGVAMGDQNVSDVMKQMNEKLKK